MLKRRIFYAACILCLPVLLAACNSGPFAISGTLINGATGEPFEAGRVILCRKTGENTCDLRTELVAEVGEGGGFNFERVEGGQ